MEHIQQQPIAVWSTARDVWETPQTEGLFCEHLDVFSETFPTSGLTRSGMAYALPTWAPRMGGSGCSSLPTPRATRGGSHTETMRLLPTPLVDDAANTTRTSGDYQSLTRTITTALP